MVKFRRSESYSNRYKAGNLCEVHQKGVATVSWKAVAGADGYDVYCASSKKSQKGTVVKGTTKLTANKTKLTSGKTYYFRARAYKMVGCAKVYTGYSAVKSVKVK